MKTFILIIKIVLTILLILWAFSRGDIFRELGGRK